MSSDAIIVFIASQRVFIVVSIYFVIDSVRKLFHTPLYRIRLRISCVLKLLLLHWHSQFLKIVQTVSKDVLLPVHFVMRRGHSQIGSSYV